MSFKDFIVEKQEIKKVDFAVLHTNDNYTPSMTGLKAMEVENYFSVDNGFEDGDHKVVQKLKTGEVSNKFASIVVVRLS
jgi:hypothetical protein